MVAGFILLFGLLILGLGWWLHRKPTAFRPRTLEAYRALLNRIHLAVEEGRQVHLSLGRNTLVDPTSPAALVGLSMAEQIADVAAVSDRPPVLTSGEGSLMLASRDVQRTVYRALSAEERYDPQRGQVTGLTPFSYAAGTLTYARDDRVALHVVAGHVGSEVALLTDAVERQENMLVGGSDSLPAQAVLYATGSEPLIGEELYAGGAYLGAGPFHRSSLWAEDLMRWLLILAMLLGAVLKGLGVL